MQDKEKANRTQPVEPEESPENIPLCTCFKDPFADLPAELRPKPVEKLNGLRKVTCPGCELVYWTNRKTDMCIECEKKGIKVQGDSTEPSFFEK